MKPPIGYINGRFVPLADISIPLDDAGFVWGATVTDRLRTFCGRLFRVDEHVARFRRSCELARVRQPAADLDLAAISSRLVDENWAVEDLAVIWLATPGRPATGPTLIAYTQPLDANRIARVYRTGLRVVTTETRPALDARIKHRSRLNWWIATDEARAQEPEAEPLFFDAASGHVLETPTANIVAVFDGVITSPPTGTVLPGVSLNVVRELCHAQAIAFVERPLTVADLRVASEVLLTNTSYCVAGVSGIDGRPVPFPGPLLNRLLDAWTELVGTDVRPPAES
jgi:branched-subunit amino acid aminotransferase/4-amino-4-deoxychorismate lyase